MTIALIVNIKCSSIHFDKDMPTTVTSRIEIDDYLLGNYSLVDSIILLKNEQYYNCSKIKKISLSNDSIKTFDINLTINKKIINYQGKIFYYYKNDLDNINSICKSHSKEKRSIENNYRVFESSFEDTLVNLKNKDKFKRFNNKYYINRYFTKNDWEILQISVIDKNNFTLDRLNNLDEAKLKKYLITKNNILYNLVRMNNNEFTNFVIGGGFRERYKFARKCN